MVLFVKLHHTQFILFEFETGWTHTSHRNAIFEVMDCILHILLTSVV